MGAQRIVRAESKTLVKVWAVSKGNLVRRKWSLHLRNGLSSYPNSPPSPPPPPPHTHRSSQQDEKTNRVTYSQGWENAYATVLSKHMYQFHVNLQYFLTWPSFYGKCRVALSIQWFYSEIILKSTLSIQYQFFVIQQKDTDNIWILLWYYMIKNCKLIY